MGMRREQMCRRIFWTHVTALLVFCGLLLRIFAIGQGEQYTAAAARQRSYTLSAGNTRGTIYDCNLKPLVNRVQNHYLAVDSQPETVALLRDALPDEQFSAILPELQSGKPLLIKSDATVTGAGITPLSVAERYSQDQLAPHVIGYVNGDGEGVCGIEAGFNDELIRWGGSVKVRYAVNAWKMSLGDAATLEDTRGSLKAGVVLTLDRDLQTIVENAAAQLGKGAVVLMKADTGEIKAMASFPDYDVSNVAASLQSEESPLLNRATSAWNVGSIFKICVTAAGLESGTEFPRHFICNGFYQLGNQRYYCHNRAGHGEENLRSGFMESCNPYFVEVGQRTGGEQLLRMANSMGFGSSYTLASGIVSAAGTLPTMSEMTEGELANFSFGQGKLTATPVQVAKMISIVANGGYDIQPTLFKGVTSDGSSIETTSFGQPLRVISVGTAETLRELMVAVVEEGTGTRAENVYCGAGGKTASAQTGTYDEDGKEIVHAWFGGFFPAEEPEYALVVFQEAGQSGGQIPAQVFREISEAVYLHEHPELEKTLES